jgi:HAD superfamily hydrolase (TIGR01509 family)
LGRTRTRARRPKITSAAWRTRERPARGSHHQLSVQNDTESAGMIVHGARTTKRPGSSTSARRLANPATSGGTMEGTPRILRRIDEDAPGYHPPVAAYRDRLRAVLYDWDGTLVDSAEKSYRCYVKVFSTFGIAFDHASYESTYSPDWYRTYDAVGLPRERWSEADALWTRSYEREPSLLLPGARAVLERFSRGGTAQGLVSSGEASRVRRELRAHSLERFFGDAVVCGGETSRRKPHPEPLLAGLARLGVRPDEAAYVGDSPENVSMARAAGVLAIGVPGGFPNREALAASGPDLLCPDLESAVCALLR